MRAYSFLCVCFVALAACQQPQKPGAAPAETITVSARRKPAQKQRAHRAPAKQREAVKHQRGSGYNVLVIVIDDLNDWVGCLDGHPDTRTPNIDRLASRGVLFTNAHCQAPICNPSRTSFMLGLRPSTTGIYFNRPWFRVTPRNKFRVTLGQHFAAEGYRTFTTGKIYHASRVDKPSFQVVGPRPGQRNPQDNRVRTDLPTGVSSLWDFGPQDFDERNFNDFVDASWAIQQLEASHDRPFFLMVGFYRPHVPFYAPRRLFHEIPRSTVTLPAVKDDDGDDLPEIAKRITTSRSPPPHEWFVKNDAWRDAVQAYLACVRFTDEQVGRLLDVLDRGPYANNTIVVLLSDHGFHLGEKQRWAKSALWERSTRVPFIISVPGGLKGARCARSVELLSLFPTLIELCDVATRPELEGASLVPLLKDPDAAWQRPAITTFGRNNHAIRTEHWRYIRYADGSEELYATARTLTNGITSPATRPMRKSCANIPGGCRTRTCPMPLEGRSRKDEKKTGEKNE